MLEHGGNLNAASARFGEPEAGWLDLSTGISPWSWPVPEIPAEVWQRLPSDSEALRLAASSYYGAAVDDIYPVPGSQMAIRHIPQHVHKARVAIPVPGYEEHRQAWQDAGHQVVAYRDAGMLMALVGQGLVDHVVVINPNNPAADVYDRDDLLTLLNQLPRQGVMVVDEAFGDVQPEHSLAAYCDRPGLFVLKSLGKFFGLAGIRLGFCISGDRRIKQMLPHWQPWGVSHPALYIGEQALRDQDWQQAQQQRLRAHSSALYQLLEQPLGEWGVLRRSALFVSFFSGRERCQRIYEYCARQGVLLRLGEWDTGGWLRIGLPGDEVDRLAHVLLELEDE